MEDKGYLIALQKIGLGAVTLTSLWRQFGNFQSIWEADRQQLQIDKWINDGKIDLLLERRSQVDPQLEWARIKRLGFQLIILEDEDYPELLKSIHNPPLGLYVLGELRRKETTLAIVGSRRPTPYGRKVAEDLGQELAENGVTIVSGMARGIDTFGHRGALKVDQGRTVAVLGSGLDIVYPPENKELYLQISRCGAVVSEFAPGTPPDGKNFPQRNRIISGLSWGTIVVEAAEKSGSLITADLAMEQGREVFAVPGPITSPLSRGTNRLLKQGAILIQSTRDVLDEFLLQPLFENRDSQASLILNDFEQAILKELSCEPVDFDTLVANTGLNSGQVGSSVTFLELKGIIAQLPGRRFVRLVF